MTKPLRDKMSADETQHLRRMQKRYYPQADRLAKKALLAETGAYRGMHRKSIIRHLDGPTERQPHHHERGAVYGPESGAARAAIWKAADSVCLEHFLTIYRTVALSLT
ncbi:MAG: hypothetical protein MUQ10_03675, partial [Anaerolineae bacterium]|nr:hypothetical protein [Anaerolineae bacterium]